MTYQTLYKLCQRQTGNKNADTLLGFKDYLNLGQKEIAGAFDNWRELQKTATMSLTDGVESYTLATDFWKMRKVFISSPTNNEAVLEEYNYSSFRDFNPVTTNDSEAVPQYWYFDPNDSTKIRFYPIPDSSYTVSYDYLYLPSDMSADADTPFFPARWHHILADFALSYYYRSAQEGREDLANNYETRFYNGLAKCVSDSKRRNLELMPISYGSGVNE